MIVGIYKMHIKIKGIIGIEHFDNTKILIDKDDKLPERSL